MVNTAMLVISCLEKVVYIVVSRYISVRERDVVALFAQLFARIAVDVSDDYPGAMFSQNFDSRGTNSSCTSWLMSVPHSQSKVTY